MSNEGNDELSNVEIPRVTNNFYGGMTAASVNFGTVHERGHTTLAGERQRLFFQFFRQALTQSWLTFLLSILFLFCGAAIVVASGVLALLDAQNPNNDYLPLVTGLTGILMTTGGGALAIHANRARRHLTQQATQLDEKIEADHKLEQARKLIDRVRDPHLKDRLNAVTAMRVLDIHPDRDTTANRVLPERE